MSDRGSEIQRFELAVAGVERSPDHYLAVIDKFSQRPAYEAAVASDEDVDQAVRGARAALGTALPAYRRYDILMAVAADLEARADLLVEVLIREGGKPRKASAAEVQRAVETLRWSAEEAKRINGEFLPLEATQSGVGRWAFTVREPVGVVAAITPSNSPLNLVAHKVGPGIAAGNAVLVKPPLTTPVCSLILRESFLRAGLPPGFLSVLVGPGLGERLLSHPGVDFYNFTGSVEVGEEIRRSAGLRGSLLELGGNSPVIVCGDADVEQAAEACAAKGFLAAGQACTSVQRIYVHDSVKQQFLDRLLTCVDGLVVGDPADPSTEVGPMISVDEAERVERLIGAALAKGARRLRGTKREGSIVWPTVLTDVPRDADAHARELFGPVVVVEGFDRMDEAIDAANSTDYGLHAAVFTQSLMVAFDAVRRIDAGGVMVNEATQWRTEFMPFGGVKKSGIGREGPRYAVAEMTRVKVAVLVPGSPADEAAIR